MRKREAWGEIVIIIKGKNITGQKKKQVYDEIGPKADLGGG